MVDDKFKIKFYFSKGKIVRFKKEFALPSGGVIIEGAKGKVKFIGAEMSFRELRAMFPDKVDYMSTYKYWDGNRKVAPKTMKIEYKPEIFLNDKIKENRCFYEIFISDINSVTYTSKSPQMESLIYRIPLEFQDSLELVEGDV